MKDTKIPNISAIWGHILGKPLPIYKQSGKYARKVLTSRYKEKKYLIFKTDEDYLLPLDKKVHPRLVKWFKQIRPHFDQDCYPFYYFCKADTLLETYFKDLGRGFYVDKEKGYVIFEGGSMCLAPFRRLRRFLKYIDENY